MKNYGLGKMLLGLSLFVAVVAAMYYLYDGSIAGTGMAMVFIFPLYFLVNAPVFNIDEQRICVYSLNPFTKNIRAQVTNVEKAIVDISDYKFRIILQMKDGSYKSAVAGRYNDMKPVYLALKDTGLQIESDGVGTIDWA